VVLVPRGSSTLYDVYHYRSGTTARRMRINDNTMLQARNGMPNYEKAVAMAFRRRIQKIEGFDTGWVEFDDLEFTHILELDAVL